MARAAQRLHTLSDWKPVMLGLAETALSDGRTLHASTYYRAAEFFMCENDPDREQAYDAYVRLFRDGFINARHACHEIDFESGKLSAVHFPPNGAARDTLVIHGGFDSCYEEFWFWGPHFASLGYEVIMFEGPGQGASLRKHGLRLRPEWEVPVAAVLDHFNLESCTLLGISLGGFLAMRAAAFEPRLRRVVALDVMFDRFDCFSKTSGDTTADTIKRLILDGNDAQVDALMSRAMAGSEAVAWAIQQGLWTSGCTSVADYVRWVMQFSAESFSSRISQDVLLFAGTKDHLVPLHQFFRQGEMLTNARSLRMRLFTEHESAQSHCQVGNIGLMLQELEQWLSMVSQFINGWSNSVPHAASIQRPA
jgi:pimeloyl-ACP methyl ester carboxylesterase